MSASSRRRGLCLVRAQSGSLGGGEGEEEERAGFPVLPDYPGHGLWSLKHKLRMQDTSLVKAASQVSIFTVVFLKTRAVFLITLP